MQPVRRERTGQSQDRTVRIEATAEGNHVQILVAHSGAGFLHAGARV